MAVRFRPNRLWKNPFGLSFRGVPRTRDDQESCIVLKTLSARFLAAMKMAVPKAPWSVRRLTD
jgi:hypothetical protein